MIQRANPENAEQLRTAAIRAVANERSAYRGGYSESTSLDGLETSSMLISVTETSGVEPMEVDKVGAITCYRCDKPGHRKSECYGCALAKGVDEKQLTEQEEEDIFLATTGVVG